MNKARFLKTTTLDRLREEVPHNLERYRNAEEFHELLQDGSLYFEIDLKIAYDSLRQLLPPSDGNLYDVENCISVTNSLSSLSPYEARDERLWVYLCHTHTLAYARNRWPIPDDDNKAISHIRTHFFAKTNREFERDNAISRLWWMAFLCQRVVDIPLEVSLQALLYKTDVRAQIIEHPTVSQNAQVFSAIIRKLVHSLSTDKVLFDRRVSRQFMKDMNAIGGFRLLDTLSENQLDDVVDEVIEGIAISTNTA